MNTQTERQQQIEHQKALAVASEQTATEFATWKVTVSVTGNTHTLSEMCDGTNDHAYARMLVLEDRALSLGLVVSDANYERVSPKRSTLEADPDTRRRIAMEQYDKALANMDWDAIRARCAKAIEETRSAQWEDARQRMLATAGEVRQLLAQQLPGTVAFCPGTARAWIDPEFPEHLTVSDNFRPGHALEEADDAVLVADITEVDAEIMDNLTLALSGWLEEPMVLRTVNRVEELRIRYAVIAGPNERAEVVWNREHGFIIGSLGRHLMDTRQEAEEIVRNYGGRVEPVIITDAYGPCCYRWSARRESAEGCIRIMSR